MISVQKKLMTARNSIGRFILGMKGRIKQDVSAYAMKRKD